MALSRHIPITNELVFPAGVYAVGGVEQVVDFEASTREQRVQAHDRDSGLPLWAISVFDPDPEARTKVVRVKIAARTPPVLPQAPAGSPFPAVAFEGLTATPLRGYLRLSATPRLVVPGYGGSRRDPEGAGPAAPPSPRVRAGRSGSVVVPASPSLVEPAPWRCSLTAMAPAHRPSSS